MKRIVFFLTSIVLAAAVFLNTGVTAMILCGDAFEDGVLNNKDVVTLFRFVSGDKADASEKNCDFNDDGVVNNKDVASLFRAVSSGNVSYVTKEEPEEFVNVPDAGATLSVSHVFGDFMVIQRDQQIKVWGTSNRNGAKIRGTFMGKEARGTVADGKWEIVFPPQSASRVPQKLTVEDSCGNSVTISEILVGDVWLINGQSNAEQPNTDAFELIAKVVDNPGKPLRLFQEGALYVINNLDEAANPCEDTVNRGEWYWRKANRYGGYTASALGWHFGNTLVDETGIPIGIISIAASGAYLAELMPADLASSLGYGANYSYTNYGTGRFYNALTHPFLKLKFKGMIFFQGESESGRDATAANYKRDFEAVNGFDESLVSLEDMDFAVRLKKLGKHKGKKYGTLKRSYVLTSSRKFDEFGDWYLIKNRKLTKRIFTGKDRQAADSFYYDVR